MKNTIFKCLIVGLISINTQTFAGYSETNAVGDQRSHYNHKVDKKTVKQTLSNQSKYYIPADKTKAAK